MPMIAIDKVEKIADRVAKTNLGQYTVERVLAEPIIDSEGREALRITIVIGGDAVGSLDGDSVVDTLVLIQEGLH